MKDSLSNYQEFFIRDEQNDVLHVSRDILKKRKEIGSKKFWTLLNIFSGSASQKEITEFETGVTEYDRMRNRHNKNRKEMFAFVSERDGAFCRHCGSLDKLTLDHIVPLIKGGSNDDDNYQILCGLCNSRKGAK